MQAKDIADTDFLSAVDAWSGVQPVTSFFADQVLPRWVNRWELDALGPEKVVLAKAKKLIKRGLLDGCACGCRGDFVLTSAGHLAIAAWSSISTTEFKEM